MKRYKVKLLCYQNFKRLIIYLSADCVSCACYKANKFIQNAYGIGTYFLVSIKQE